MHNAEIVANHIKNNRLNTSVKQMLAELLAFDKMPGNHVAKEGDCLFLYNLKKDGVHMYIINGGSGVGYLRSLKKFIQELKRAKVPKIYIRVQNKNSATNIGNAAGGKNIQFEETNPGQVDPYTMSMEI